jgi:regulator of nucleoside diphosphate kinase
MDRKPPSDAARALAPLAMPLFCKLPSAHRINYCGVRKHMPKSRIVITEGDFALLNRLASHPHLAAELSRAAVVDSCRVPPDVVTMNSRVLFEDQSTGGRRDVTIVFPQQADASINRISVLAPVGTALLGLAAGQSIVWPFPDGRSRSLRVVKVIYQPEADEAQRARVSETQLPLTQAG